MQIDFDKIIDRRGTYCTQWDFTADRFGKEGVLPFSISDMDFQSPPEILQAIQKHTEHGIFGYTRWNHDAYKDAITGWFEKRFLAKMSAEWIVYSPSVIYTISRLIEILSDVNDNVIIQSPGYDAFFSQLNHINRKLLTNPLIYRNGIYSLDMEDLETQLAQPKTKILLLSNPHNPTGHVWTANELIHVTRLCNKYNVKIISDDIHMDIVYPNNVYTPITESTDNLEDVFICTSASKTFNTPGLGGSYAFIPDANVKERFLHIMKKRDGLSNASIFGVLAVMEGYNHATYWVDELTKYLYQNMKTVSSFIKDNLPSLKFHLPDSTYLAWIDCADLNSTDQKIQKALVDVGGVGIMSGSVYGAKDGSFLRMNVGCPRGKLLTGLERLKISIDSLN